MHSNYYGCPQVSPIVVSVAVEKVVPGFASTSGFAVAVILLKVLWDIRLHMRERQIFAASLAERGST